MVQAQTESTVQQQAQPRRLASSSAKQRVVATIAVLLMASGAALLVTAFALALSDRNESTKQTLLFALAEKIENAGLGCEDFRGNRPSGAGIVNEGQCEAGAGRLRITVYNTPKTAINRQKLNLGYQCTISTAVGETQIVSITDDSWVIKPDSSDRAAARAIRDAVGGRVTTVDCAPPPAPPPPTPDPAAEAPPE